MAFLKAASAGVALALLLCGTAAPRAAGAQKDDLPDGPGKKILLASCTSCHELTEVTKFRGYYKRKDWQDVIVTMVEYGAELKDKESEVLLDYLTTTLGRKD